MTAWSLRFCHTESIILDSTKQPITLYVKAETPVLWPPHAKSWLIGKDSDAGRDWGQEEKGTTEDEMAGWHHWLNGRESEWTLGVGDGQGGLACCDSWGRKESDTTERLIWSDLIWMTNDFEHFSCICCPLICLLWRNVYSGLLPTFTLGCLSFCCLVFKCTLNILDTGLIKFVTRKYFLHSIGWPFHFPMQR